MSSFNKFQQVSSATLDGIVIEAKPSLECLSDQSRALIKGKLKERAELMHLELMSHGVVGGAVSKAPTSATPMHKSSISSSQSSLPMGSPSHNSKSLTLFGLRPSSKAGKHPATTANQTNSADENCTSNDANASIHSKSSADEPHKSRVRIIL